MAWLTPKHASPRTCYHAELGRSVSKGVDISRGEPTKLSRAGATPLELGARLISPYKPAPQHVGYHAEFHRWS